MGCMYPVTNLTNALSKAITRSLSAYETLAQGAGRQGVFFLSPQDNSASRMTEK